ncbi:hypothetical protein ACPCI0_29160 [Streptomyces griseoincarnatus]
MSKLTKADRLRAEYMHRGWAFRIEPPEPARYYVRYVKDDGQIITRTFVMESAARKYVGRLRRYGKKHVAMYRDNSKPRWSPVEI